MCGIVGYIGDKSAQKIVLEGLTRLEYRGYDSAGVATLAPTDNPKHRWETQVQKKAGKLKNLQIRLKKHPCIGGIGIGHTRWATHGSPSDLNAHPHSVGGLTLVHNGIIENFVALKAQLKAKGCHFESDTDSEVVVHLINDFCRSSSTIEEAFLKSIRRLKGAFSMVLIDEGNPDKLLAAKMATPLVIGKGKGENFVGSDALALLDYTDRFIFLEDGDVAVIKKGSIRVTNFKGDRISRRSQIIKWTGDQAEKDGYPHFMLKEINEQPQAVSDTLGDRITTTKAGIKLDDFHLSKLKHIKRIVIIACGTSYHAGLLGEYLFEHYLKLPVEVELASEFRYRDPIIDNTTLVIAISQSGETADTLGALNIARDKGAKYLSICNVENSAIPRFCKKGFGTFFTRTGPEISVASTKAFVTQVVMLYMLAQGWAAQSKKISRAEYIKNMRALREIPKTLKSCLNQSKTIKKIAQQYKHSKSMLFLGRGLFYPMALEGALKMKEISYIHAEGFAAGEMKHGPIALLDEHLPVVVLATKGYGYEKVVSNLEEVNARAAQVIAICSEKDSALKKLCAHTITLPNYHKDLLPLMSALPLQLLAYHMAVARGCDVDKPRNLAKSVTVE